MPLPGSQWYFIIENYHDDQNDYGDDDDDVGGAARAIVEAANMDSLSLSWHWTLPTGNTIDFVHKNTF